MCKKPIFTILPFILTFALIFLPFVQDARAVDAASSGTVGFTAQSQSSNNQQDLQTTTGFVYGSQSSTQNILGPGPTSISQKEFNVKAYGAYGDGIHDDYAAIVAAITDADNYSGTDILFFPSGNYYTSKEIVINPKTSLKIGADNAIITRDYSDWHKGNEFIINIKADPLRSYAVTSSISKDSKTFNVASTSGLQIGQMVTLTTNEPYFYRGDNYNYPYNKYFCSIISNIVNSNTVELEDAIPFTFSTTGYTPKANIYGNNIVLEIAGLQLSWRGNYVKNINASELQVKNFAYPKIENVKATGSNYGDIFFVDCYGLCGDNLTAIGSLDQNLGLNYAIRPIGLINSTINNSYFESLRHPVSCIDDPDYNLLIENSVFKSDDPTGGSASFDSHASKLVKLYNDSGNSFFQFSSGEYDVDSCSFSNTYSSSPVFHFRTDAASIGFEKLVVTNSKLNIVPSKNASCLVHVDGQDADTVYHIPSIGKIIFDDNQVTGASLEEGIIFINFSDKTPATVGNIVLSENKFNCPIKDKLVVMWNNQLNSDAIAKGTIDIYKNTFYNKQNAISTDGIEPLYQNMIDGTSNA